VAAVMKTDLRVGNHGKPVIRVWEAEAEALWDEGKLSAAEIAAKFGVTKNALLGIAHRRDWSTRGQLGKYPPRTLDDRLDALHAKFDATLKECKTLMEISRRKAAAGLAKEHDSDQRDQTEDGVRVPDGDQPRRVGHPWSRPVLVRVPGAGVRKEAAD